MKTLTAVLFAGGESRRMGTDKATLAINGEPLWSRQLKVLCELSPERIIISARSRPAWCPPEIEIVPDASPSHGPLSGLAATLADITTTHALVLAMDLPLMKAAFMRGLWAECETGVGAVPVCSDALEPLCAIYPKAAASLINGALAGEDFSLHGAIEILLTHRLMRTAPVSPADQSAFLNLNSPAELSALKSQLGFF